MLLKIAWRNIWRHKTRSTVIIVSVLFGIWSGLFIQAVMNGMVEERIKTAIEKEISHIQLHHPEFKKDYDVEFVINNGVQILNETKRSKNVKAASGRSLAKGMLATATGSAGINIIGVNSSDEDSATNLSKNIIEGTFLSEHLKHEMVIGEKLHKKLKLKLNSKVVITLTDKDKNITSGAFRIKGIYKTKNSTYDEANVFVNINELNSLLNTPNSVHEIAILLNTNETLDTVYNSLKSKYPDIKTETWQEVSPETNLLLSTTNQSMLIFMSIIMLALAFGIINTMLMAVLERTREIGMLIALGMNKARVFKMILIETVLLVLTGTPFGILLGFITTQYFGIHGIRLSGAQELYSSFGMSETIFLKLNISDYLVVIELVIITSLISSIFPARKALSLNPSDAIRK
ncbi:MAG: ABC transporter permease [Bacteroidota bacterium]